MGDDSSLDADVLARLSALDDPVRQRLYAYVRDCDQPPGRDQAAEAAGISRSLAAYHLDKLVDAGLLTVGYARPPGRTGPGAGRPAKIYFRADRDLALTVPPRDYELLARLLVSSVGRDATGAVRDAVNRAAYEAGCDAGARSPDDLLAVLSSCGYQPRTAEDDSIDLCNCPFHALSEEHRDVVCGLNLHLIQGVLDGGDHQHAHAETSFRPHRCCVVIHSSRPDEDRAVTEP